MKNVMGATRLFPTLLVLGLLGACGQPLDSASSPEKGDQQLIAKSELASETERVLIADGASAVVRVFDVAEGAVISNFSLAATASLYTGDSGRFAYAVQSSGNQVSILDGSLVFVDHGDHQHYDKYDPILLDSPLLGNNPIHLVAHDNYVATFFDNDGEALILDERSLLSPQRVEWRIKTAMPHHGVAVPFASAILATRAEVLPGSPRATPVGIDVYGKDGLATGQYFGPCFSTHGEAARTSEVAFGCDDGVLIVKNGVNGLEGQKLLNPAPTDGVKTRVGTLASHDKVPYFVGNFGQGKYAEIDSSAGSFTIVNAPLDYAQFKFSKDGSLLLFLGKDGQLALVDSKSRQLVHQSMVTTASTGANHGARDPKMAIGKNLIYISSPVAGELIIFSLKTLGEVGRFKVSGEPTALSVFNFPS